MPDGKPTRVDHRIDMSSFNENVGAGDCAVTKFVCHRGIHCVAWLLGLLLDLLALIGLIRKGI